MQNARGKRRWLTYLLRCADGSIYTGVTNDLERRLEAHNRGRGAKYTRSRRPVRLAAAFGRRTKAAAMSEEARIKRMPRAAKLALIRRLRKTLRLTVRRQNTGAPP